MLVLDNSVSMSWCFEDQRTDYTTAVLKALVDGCAVVPALWFLEVANVGWQPFASSPAVVALVAAAAASVPAWRTTFLSPMAAIREQAPSVWRWTGQRMQRDVREIRVAIPPLPEQAGIVEAAPSIDEVLDANGDVGHEGLLVRL